MPREELDTSDDLAAEPRLEAKAQFVSTHTIAHEDDPMAPKNGAEKTAPRGGEPVRSEERRDEKSRGGEAGNKPVHEVRLGRIRAAIWLNDTENGPRYNVQISRLYKDQKDKWKDSTSFGREDLPLVAKVADLAMVWIYENPAGAEK